MPALVKRLIIGLVVLAALLIGGTLVYTKLINHADKEFSQTDVEQRLGATGSTGDGIGTGAPTGAGVDGPWTIGDGSEVGYRVNETINGIDTTANGRSTAITGSLTITGTTVSAAEFSVDMATFASNESRRDGQFRGRIMNVAKYPTATFTLTAPIDFQQIPTDAGTVKANATGDLTLHGVTKSVSFELTATFRNGHIGVLGQIPIVFADHNIDNPSFATITTDDHGVLEFVLVLGRT